MSLAKKKLLVLGAGGLLGKELLSGCYLSDWDVVGHSRTEKEELKANLSNVSETFIMLNAVKPNVIINLVGLTNVDRCESHPDEAYSGNVKTIENVVAWIGSVNEPVYLIHLSTDQVYDGGGPYSESEVALKNYYAFSKYCAELIAVSVDATILRTNFIGKSKCAGRDSLTDWIFKKLTAGEKINVFDDVCFSPLSMKTLCLMIELVLKKQHPGIYNLGSKEGFSKADLAFQFAETLHLNQRLMSRSLLSNLEGLATYRPSDMRLNVEYFEKVFEVQLPLLSNEIQKIAREYYK